MSEYRAVTISMILPLPSYEKEKLAAGQDMFFCCGSLAAAGKSSLVEFNGENQRPVQMKRSRKFRSVQLENQFIVVVKEARFL